MQFIGLVSLVKLLLWFFTIIIKHLYYRQRTQSAKVFFFYLFFSPLNIKEKERDYSPSGRNRRWGVQANCVCVFFFLLFSLLGSRYKRTVTHTRGQTHDSYAPIFFFFFLQLLLLSYLKIEETFIPLFCISLAATTCYIYLYNNK